MRAASDIDLVRTSKLSREPPNRDGSGVVDLEGGGRGHPPESLHLLFLAGGLPSVGRCIPRRGMKSKQTDEL